MRNFFKVIFFCISLCACKDNYSVNLPNNKNDFISMSCSDLMLHLIEDSSYGNTFLDKKLALEFFFERIDVDHIILKFVRGAGVARGLIYANFELDLVSNTLNNIDADPPIPIKFKLDYIPFIAEKCTADKNLYGDTGKLPDKELDGSE